jgi:hypothetical protein
MRFALIDGAKAEVPVHRLCRVLGIASVVVVEFRGGQEVVIGRVR